MDRRSYLRLRRFKPLIIMLRLMLAGMAIFGAYLGGNYILQRSRMEVEALKNRPKPDIYLGADQVKMTVLDDRGNLTMEITGESVELSSDQRFATFSKAKAKYFEGGRVSLEIEAGQLKYDTLTEDFHITRGDDPTVADALTIRTSDGWTIKSEEVEWRRFKETGGAVRAQRPPSFRFPKGVTISSRDGNVLAASYMQADRDLQYMEFVGNFTGDIRSLQDTQFIRERNLTDPEQLKVEDIENIQLSAEQVIYDKRRQVVLATSRYYERPFQVKDFDGNLVQVGVYQSQPQQVLFKKTEATILADHIEAHLSREWAESFGNITMIIPPSAPKPGDDKALQEMRKYETRIAAGDIEYFWGRDHVISHDRAIVTQEDRRAEADSMIYWGDQRMVLLDGGVLMAQGSGDWLTNADLVAVKDADQARMLQGYTELFADRAVVYLNNNDFIAQGDVLARQDNRETTADTVVYQDDIKRLTAKGDVKFRDVDGQTFVAGGLIYHNETEYLQVEGGTAATIRLPARYANDINRTIAETREEPAPEEVTDPPVPDEPTRNPNEGNRIEIESMPPLPEGSGGLGIPELGVPSDPGAPPPIFIPDDGTVGPMPPDDGAVPPLVGPQVQEASRQFAEMRELFLELSDDADSKQPAPDDDEQEGG